MGQHNYYALWSNNQITVDTPAHRVQYDGKELSVEDKHLVSTPHCGLCGDGNQDRRGDLKSALQCVHRSIRTMAQSYRIEDSECLSKISPADKLALKEEKRLCTQSKVIQPHSQSPSSRREENIQPERKHLVLHKARQICFSKEMQPQCPNDSAIVQLQRKTVQFICVPSNNAKAKDWVLAVERKEAIPELASLASPSPARCPWPSPAPGRSSPAPPLYSTTSHIIGSHVITQCVSNKLN